MTTAQSMFSFVKYPDGITNILVDVIQYSQNSVRFPKGIRLCFELPNDQENITIPVRFRLDFSFFGKELNTTCVSNILHTINEQDRIVVEGGFECAPVEVDLDFTAVDCPIALLNQIKESFFVDPTAQRIYLNTRELLLEQGQLEPTKITSLLSKKSLVVKIESFQCILTVKRSVLRKDRQKLMAIFEVE